MKAKRGRRGAKNTNWRWRLYAAALLCLAGLCLGGWRLWRSDAVQMHFVYMWPYQQEILQYSAKNGIDPFLVAAIIKNESDFNQKAVSRAGAVGLMQIMPETGRWIAAQMGLSGYSEAALYDVTTNIRMGCWYVNELEHEFHRNLTLLAVAYNAGRGQTREWMRLNGWDYDFTDVQHIPYADTRTYVSRVLRDRDRYYLLYRDQLGQKNY